MPSLTASFSYVISNTLSRGFAFLFTPIFTRVLSPEEYGVYSLYTSILTIVTVFTTPDTSGGAIYRVLAKEGTDNDNVVSSALGLQLISSLSLLIITFVSARLPLKSITYCTTFSIFLEVIRRK